jgi:hypothetical protein
MASCLKRIGEAIQPGIKSGIKTFCKNTASILLKQGLPALLKALNSAKALLLLVFMVLPQSRQRAVFPPYRPLF